MRHSVAIWLLLATCMFPAARAAEQPAPPSSPLTLDQYVQILDLALSNAHKLKDEPTQAGELLRTLPAAWQVNADGKDFNITTDSLRRDLGAWQKEPDNARLDRIVQHLETLRYQAEASRMPVAIGPSRRELLNSILARSEFRNVHGESWMDRLKQRLTGFLLKLLGRIFSSSSVPVISNILVYGLIAFAALALAYWLYRSIRESARVETILPSGMPVSAKQWPIWMAEAQAAATRGDWRDAVHLAYWAGISFLEAGGAWRPDLARTPREYLRLLPAASDHQPVLRALTVRLETCWYGMQPADSTAFQQTLVELERLGCPCN